MKKNNNNLSLSAEVGMWPVTSGIKTTQHFMTTVKHGDGLDIPAPTGPGQIATWNYEFRAVYQKILQAKVRPAVHVMPLKCCRVIEQDNDLRYKSLNGSQNEHFGVAKSKSGHIFN